MQQDELPIELILILGEIWPDLGHLHNHLNTFYATSIGHMNVNITKNGRGMDYEIIGLIQCYMIYTSPLADSTFSVSMDGSVEVICYSVLQHCIKGGMCPSKLQQSQELKKIPDIKLTFTCLEKFLYKLKVYNE